MKEINATSYRQRNEILRSLGFSSYSDYLQGPLWAWIKSEVFQMHGSKCFLCKERAFTVHHHKYTLKNLSGRDLKCLYPICKKCHTEVEMDGPNKRTLTKTKKFFNQKKKVLKAERKRRLKEQKKRRALIASKPQARKKTPTQLGPGKSFPLLK